MRAKARAERQPKKRSHVYFQRLLCKHGASAAYPFTHDGKEYVALDRSKTTLVLRNLGDRQIKIRSPSIRQDIGERLAREGRASRISRLDFGNA